MRVIYNIILLVLWLNFRWYCKGIEVVRILRVIVLFIVLIVVIYLGKSKKEIFYIGNLFMRVSLRVLNFVVLVEGLSV